MRVMVKDSRPTGDPVRNVGIVTLPLHRNYGGILQAAGLYQFLKSEGHNVVFFERTMGSSLLGRIKREVLGRIPGQNVLGVRQQWLKQNFHRRFFRKYLPKRTGPLGSSADMARATDVHRLEAIVVGSDQVWRKEYGNPKTFRDRFLGFLPGDGVRRISYAASFGNGHWAYPEDTDAIRALLARFDAVSVREKSGVDICRDALDRSDCAHVLDPTLLVSPDFWRTVAAPARPRSGKVLMRYILDQSADVLATCEAVRARLGSDYAIDSASIEGGGSDYLVPEWIRFFRDADFVVTDSFHGMVFSILFRKNFVAIINEKRGADRFVSLTGLLGLSDRLVSASDKAAAVGLAGQPIDYDGVQDRLQALRNASAEFLRTALSQESPRSVGDQAPRSGALPR